MAGIQTGKKDTTTVSNMNNRSLAALEALIASLAGGGTSAQRGDRAARTQAVQRTAASQEDYSKNAAFADAQAAMQAQMRQALATLLPQLVRSAEASGTSQNALRALMTQQGAAQAAEGAAALGLKAAVDYGNVNSSLGSVLERLTTGADPAQQALIQALNVAKGAQTTMPQDNSVTLRQPAPSLGGLSTATSTMPNVGIRDPYANSSMSYFTGQSGAESNLAKEMDDALNGFKF
jgi:hypothetical protein